MNSSKREFVRFFRNVRKKWRLFRSIFLFFFVSISSIIIWVSLHSLVFASNWTRQAASKEYSNKLKSSHKNLFIKCFKSVWIKLYTQVIIKIIQVATFIYNCIYFKRHLYKSDSNTNTPENDRILLDLLLQLLLTAFRIGFDVVSIASRIIAWHLGTTRLRQSFAAETSSSPIGRMVYTAALQLVI